jgi:hypothetical protein
MQCACAVLYYHLWAARLCNIFPHFLTNGPIFEKKVIEHKMCVLIFSTTFVSEISHCKKNWAKCDHKCLLVFVQSTRYSCPIWKNLNLIDRFSKVLESNVTNIRPSAAEFYDMIWYDMIYLTAIGLTPGGSGTVNIYTQYTEYRDGRTDGHDEANCRFSQFCERA